jgi:hypothetical protein
LNSEKDGLSSYAGQRSHWAQDAILKQFLDEGVEVHALPTVVGESDDGKNSGEDEKRGVLSRQSSGEKGRII